jgi:hypothetical protein
MAAECRRSQSGVHEAADLFGRLEDFDRRYGNRPSVAMPPAFDKNKTRPGRRANVFVRADAPQYARLLEALKTADPADWKLDETGRPGIWVARGLV